MKKLISLIVLLVLGGLYAFSAIFPKAEASKITFPVREELQGQVIPLDSALFRYPYRLRANVDRVVMEDLHGMDHFFHLLPILIFVTCLLLDNVAKGRKRW